MVFGFGKKNNEPIPITEQLENARRAVGSVAVFKLEKLSNEELKEFVSANKSASTEEIYNEFLKMIDAELRNSIGFAIDPDIVDKHYDQEAQQNLELETSMDKFFAEVMEFPDQKMFGEFVDLYNSRTAALGV